MDNEDVQEHNQFEELIQGLIDQKYGCCNDFLLPSTVTGMLNNIEQLSLLGSLKDSGIGNQQNPIQDKAIRGDKINWIEGQSTNPFEAIYLKKIERFITHLNSTCFTTINSFESHYALYEKKSFYKRHFDQFRNEKGRQFSTIVYLNQNWLDQDGGMLSLHLENGEQIDIAPVSGRMVFFKSDEMEHEVKESTTRNRMSIAGWLKN